ncbi:MAG TPA: radical SAM protein, partial [Geobacteraceae bacterium]|nr:radical SAM protein [Geobacteraceae bacterium]
MKISPSSVRNDFVAPGLLAFTGDPRHLSLKEGRIPLLFLSLMRLSCYFKIYPSPGDPDTLLLYSTKKGATVLVPAALLAAINDESINPSDRETLARLGFLVPDTEAEKKELREAFAEANRLSAKFTAQVLLNLDCNLACTYCYEGGMKGRHYISPETARLLAEMVERDHISRGKGVELSFYGGEPLMSLDLIVSISERLQKAAAAKGSGYSFTMVTNGTLLTAAIVEKLLPLG